MSSRVEIKCVTVPDGKIIKRDQDLNTEQMRRAIEDRCKVETREGWTLRAMSSRGRTMYLVFARKERR